MLLGLAFLVFWICLRLCFQTILKIIIFLITQINNLFIIITIGDQVQSILVCSLCEMLEKAKTEDSAIKVVTLKDHIKLPSKNAECARLKEEEGEGETTSTSSKSPPGSFTVSN